MILLDTNVVSEMRPRKGAGHAAFAGWAKAVATEPLFLSAITIFELERGAMLLERRDPRQGAALRDWLNEGVLPRFAERILPVDQEVSSICAGLNATRTRPDLDAFIAATALAHKLPLATRNVRDFADTGVKLVNPWDYRVGTGSAPE